MPKPRRAPDIYVSDHAIVRYFERHHNFDIVALRRQIANTVRPGADAGAFTVISDGLKFRLKGRSVVTVAKA